MKTLSLLKTTVTASVIAAIMLAGCSDEKEGEKAGAGQVDKNVQAEISTGEDTGRDDAKEVTVEAHLSGTYSNSEDGGHVIMVDGETAEYRDAAVTKTGDSEGDEADFYGENSAIFATNGAHLSLLNMNITTDGTHANAVFSYGEGTVVDISNSTIETSGNCSGGIMTTGGGTMNASNLTIHTSGRSSAAIRSDRGGGTVTVNGGNYITDGVGSPAIYSTADITVNDAALTTTASEGVVVEGKNSVTLNNVVMNADNNQHNSDKSGYYHAVMIYQSMSGDADAGLSRFSAAGGNINNVNGDVFFVNNTATDISLSGVNITNNGGGAFLRAAAAGWGNEGTNGGKVNLTATGQKIDGDMIVDEISVLNLYLKEGSTFTGAVNPEGSAGEAYVELSGGSKWILTADSYISSLTCDADSVDLNGHTLTIDGKVYTEGSASEGAPIEINTNEEGGGREGMPEPPDGQPPEKSNGEPPQGGGKQDSEDGDKQPPQNGEIQSSQGGEMRAPQDGEMPTPPDGQPPEKPDGEPPQKPDGVGGPGGGNPPEKPN